MGQWPTWLAQGYTSLIPKPGEEGPLGTRPLTFLYIVYRMWAGTRLWEAMRWQEAGVHPRAYGFRLARGAVDAAKSPRSSWSWPGSRDGDWRG